MGVHQFAELHQGAESDPGPQLVGERRAMLRLEHPHWDGDLEFAFQSDDHARFGLLAKGAYDLNVLAEERVISIRDMAVLQVMSSVRSR